ncbi:HNH endonuclease (plasmid) [Aneurinibacillus thermoaerophilus]|uniref:HNH endonuclease n=1 Tax=Aneurinibacillus thermoaerophilus TaxID=143495 RepID=A0ABX8YFZ8_ANETH|nr:HNH endonuclease signature motif containing protein [Aneurinibacillus thermoaerophilus]QYY44732.1 HNH endonuclease [Aneurinibacillus thermoaerophilus]
MRVLNLAEEFHPVPKPSFKRSRPKRKSRSEFSASVRQKIDKRDGKYCQECGNPNAPEMHHVMPRGRGGRGVVTNGLRLCVSCHDKIHEDAQLMSKWQGIFEWRFGPDYYKDEWDVK